jgi:hypothetical protein
MYSAAKDKPNSVQSVDVKVTNFGYESLANSEADSFDAGKERLVGEIEGMKRIEREIGGGEVGGEVGGEIVLDGGNGGEMG